MTDSKQIPAEELKRMNDQAQEVCTEHWKEMTNQGHFPNGYAFSDLTAVYQKAAASEYLRSQETISALKDSYDTMKAEADRLRERLDQRKAIVEDQNTLQESILEFMKANVRLGGSPPSGVYLSGMKEAAKNIGLFVGGTIDAVYEGAGEWENRYNEARADVLRLQGEVERLKESPYWIKCGERMPQKAGDYFIRFIATGQRAIGCYGHNSLMFKDGLSINKDHWEWLDESPQSSIPVADLKKGKYKKRPMIVDAVRWTGDNEIEIMDFVGQKLSVSKPPHTMEHDRDIPTEAYTIQIQTPEGAMTASRGDWIIKGHTPERGNHYWVNKPDYFKQAYEPVDTESPSSDVGDIAQEKEREDDMADFYAWAKGDMWVPYPDHEGYWADLTIPGRVVPEKELHQIFLQQSPKQ